MKVVELERSLEVSTRMIENAALQLKQGRPVEDEIEVGVEEPLPSYLAAFMAVQEAEMEPMSKSSSDTEIPCEDDH